MENIIIGHSTKSDIKSLQNSLILNCHLDSPGYSCFIEFEMLSIKLLCESTIGVYWVVFYIYLLIRFLQSVYTISWIVHTG